MISQYVVGAAYLVPGRMALGIDHVDPLQLKRPLCPFEYRTNLDRPDSYYCC